MEVLRSCLVLLICGLAVAAAFPPAMGGAGSAVVTTSSSVTVSGVVGAEVSSGAFLLREPSDIANARLEADSIEIRMEWEKGAEIRDDEGSLFGFAQERGTDSVRIEDAVVMFRPQEGDPTLLGFAETDARGFRFESGSGLSLGPIAPGPIVQVGSSPDTVGAGSDIDLGFWYGPEGPAVAGSGAGTLQFSGSFVLFGHDLTIHAQGPHASWSDWTGYRESQPGAPATQYELRVTTIHVSNGTLTGEASSLGFFAESVAAEVTGTVASHEVTGRLAQQDGVRVFNSEPIRLEGEGSLGVQASGPQEDEEDARLVLRPSGSFTVLGGSRIAAPAGAGGAGSAVLFGTLGGLTVALTAGLVVMGVVPAPIEHSRRIRYDRWMRRGKEASRLGEWDRASRCFEHAVGVRSGSAHAWYRWAQAELEAGRPESAERVAVQATGVEGIDPLDLLDLRATAAWESGDEAAFGSFVCRLAASSPEMARVLLVDLDVDASSFGPEFVHLLEDDRHGEGLDGYS